MRGDQILSKEIEMYFRLLLESFYEEPKDIPNIKLEVAFEYPQKAEKCVQYFISEDQIIIKSTGIEAQKNFEYMNDYVSSNIFFHNSKQTTAYIRTSQCNMIVTFVFPSDSQILCGIAEAFSRKIFGALQNFISNIDLLTDRQFEPTDYLCFQNCYSSDFEEKVELVSEHECKEGNRTNASHNNNVLYNTHRYRMLIIFYDEKALILDAVSDVLNWHFNLNIHMVSMLSTAKYEGAQLLGTLVKGARGYYRKKGHQAKIKFDSKIDFEIRNIRYIRKILEISNSQLPLLITYDNKIIGLTTCTMTYECKINILGALRWDLVWNNQKICFKDGIFKIPSSKHSTIDFPKKLMISNESLGKMQCIIQQAAKQIHGTLIIVGHKRDIVMEVKRLCKYNRGMEISPINLFENQEIIINLTAIDGAIMIDTDCICYAIGVILDGESVTKGTPSRGARYNSAINYIKSKNIKGQIYDAIIISEDRTIDVI